MSSTGAFLCAVAFVSTAAACDPRALVPEQRVAQVRELDRGAQADMEQRRFREAVAKLQEALCLAPDSSRVYYELGVAQAGSGDFKDARESLRNADRLQPASKLPLVMQVRVNFALHDLDTLKTNLRDAAARFPRDLELHSVLARFLTENQLYELALAESLRARSSADASSQVELAGLENTVGAYDDAIRNASEIERNTLAAPGVRAAAAGIAGLSYEATARHQDALLHLRQAIQFDPAKENSYLALAEILDKSQQSVDAVAILQQGRRVLPQSNAFLLPLGIALVHAEQYKDAIAVLRDAIKAAPDDDQAYLNIAAACRNSGDNPGEIQILRDLAERIPRYPMIHLLTARALLNADPVDYPRVMAQLTAAEKSNPTDADLFYLRGKVAVANGDLEKAQAAFQRSIDLRPMDPSAYYQLGRVYQKLGQVELAKDNLERAVMLGSGDRSTSR
jgi:tetratricopeptide (TPR) repeat protein